MSSIPAIDFQSKWTGPDELELTVTEFDPKRVVHKVRVLYLTANQAGSLADLLNAEVQIQKRDLAGEDYEDRLAVADAMNESIAAEFRAAR